MLQQPVGLPPRHNPHGVHEREVPMAIVGAHVLLYTTQPEALRATLRDVFGWTHVDAGEGWLIFRLPPAEIGVHPAEGPTWESGQRHQFSLMCDDIHQTVRDLRAKGIEVKGEPENEGWGISVMTVLPGGVEVQVYQPLHPVAADLGRTT
jgi:hypothetical protein